MEPDRDTQQALDRLDRASDHVTELVLTGRQARSLANFVYRLTEAAHAKDLMAEQLNQATDRANRMERQYLDIESGGVHFDLESVREQLTIARAHAAAAKQRQGDIIAELRRQLDRQVKYRAHDLAAITRVRAVATALDTEANQEHGGRADGMRDAADRVRSAVFGQVPDGH